MQIGEIAKMMNLPISTIRYYDKNSLLPNLKRKENNLREFTKDDIDSLNMIHCLKSSGMKIKEIKEFMDWCKQGDSTIDKRFNMFIKQEENIKKEIEFLERNLKLIQFKKWYYGKALKDGTVNKVKNMAIKDMPKEIQILYKDTH